MKIQSLSAPPGREASCPDFSIDPEKLLYSIVDTICVIDNKGIFRYVSPSGSQLFGYSPEEMTGASFMKFIHPEDIEKSILMATDRSNGCQASNFQNRYYHKNGSVVYINWSGRWDVQDKLLYCVARDCSEQYEIEHRLEKAQKMARVANYEFDILNGVYTYTSDTFFEIFGLDKGQHRVFTSSLFWSLLHPEDVEEVKRTVLFPEYMNSDTFEYRIIRPDGQVAYINRLREIIRDAAGNPVKTIGTLQDITDCKRTELALRQSKERFRALVQNGNDLIGIIDANGYYSFVGSNVYQHLGYREKDLIGRSAFEFIHPDDVPTIMECLQTIKDQTALTAGPFRFRNGNGEWRWVETRISNQLHNPAIQGLVVNSKDVTDKKQKEDELTASDQRFKALVQKGSDLIVIIDKETRVNYVSDNVSSVLGYTSEEILGRKAFDLVHPNDADKVADRINRVLESNETPQGVLHRFLHKSGRWVWLESKGSNHLDNPSINGILVNSRNITERVNLQRRLNRELINKQREITSAVIKAQESERSQLGLELHDNVNQVLTTVKLYNEMYITGYIQDKDLLVRSAGYIQDCINEIRSISKRLSAPTLGKISLHDSIKELVDSINLTRRVEIQYRPQNIRQCPVTEDIHLAIYRIVQEGLNNIIKYSGARSAVVELSRRDGLFCLTISDDGQGFDPRSVRKGIGITNMKTRAENLHATFKLESAPGEGCTIEICFPYNEETISKGYNEQLIVETNRLTGTMLKG